MLHTFKRHDGLKLIKFDNSLNTSHFFFFYLFWNQVNLPDGITLQSPSPYYGADKIVLHSNKIKKKSLTNVSGRQHRGGGRLLGRIFFFIFKGKNKYYSIQISQVPHTERSFHIDCANTRGQALIAPTLCSFHFHFSGSFDVCAFSFFVL